MRACWMASKSSTGHQHSAMRHLAVTSRLNLFIVWKMDLIFTTFCFQVSIWPAISSSWATLWSCVWRKTWKHSRQWSDYMTQNQVHYTMQDTVRSTMDWCMCPICIRRRTVARSLILPLTAIDISRLLAEVGGHSYRVARNLCKRE